MNLNMNRHLIASSDTDLEEDTEHIIFNLYQFCRDSLSIILSKTISQDLLSPEWEDMIAIHYIWENEFSVLDRELDQLFIQIGGKPLQEAICIALGSLAWSLSECTLLSLTFTVYNQLTLRRLRLD